MASKAELEKLILDRTIELRTFESAYLKAKDRTQSENGKQWLAGLYDELFTELNSFVPGDSGDKAIALIASAKHIARQIHGPLATIEDYESRKRLIDTLQAQVDQM